MFCPKCAAQNTDGASFCRVCGVNIGLVQQALAGRLPEPEAPSIYIDKRGRVKKRRTPEPASLEKGIVNVFAGIGFIVAALAIMWKFPGGIFWGWSFFFPAFNHLGKGIATIVAAQNRQASSPPALGQSEAFAPNQLPHAPQPFLAQPAGRNTGEMLAPPPSVTEGTTRHLGAEAPTRHLDSANEYQKK